MTTCQPMSARAARKSGFFEMRSKSAWAMASALKPELVASVVSSVQ